MSTYADKLRAWAADERRKGLIDIKFFPYLPGENIPTVEDACKSIYEAVTEQNYTDISEEPL